MADTPLAPVVRHLHKLAGLSPLSNVSDAQLLERFVARRDEAAFAVLMRRHGPMVIGRAPYNGKAIPPGRCV